MRLQLKIELVQEKPSANLQPSHYSGHSRDISLDHALIPDTFSEHKEARSHCSRSKLGIGIGIKIRR